MYKIISLCLMLGTATSIHNTDTWNPFQQDFQGSTKFLPSPSGLEGPSHTGYQQGAVSGSDQCEVYKVGFTQDLYFQYIQYKTEIPDLKQFTLCHWTKYYNHSNDHPIFSYAVDGQPRAIYSWISNTDRSSYFSMSVAGHTFYRLNYPLRLNRWYHTCQSWNGKTGEWQVWVNAERVGRGFHNRLVGHVIPGRGIAITGQGQSQLGGGFQEGAEAPKGSGGMLGEVTMLQLYSVALTAGKAHKDHKHHHAHQFDHNGRAITTPAPTTPRNKSPLPQHPLLTGGQINTAVRVNLAGPQTVQGQQFDARFLNGQFVGNVVTQQLSLGKSGQPLFQPQDQSQVQQLQLQPSSDDTSFSTQFITLGDTQIINKDFSHSAHSSDPFLSTHSLFKRQNDEAPTEAETSDDPKKEKRQISVVGGHFIDTSLLSSTSDAFDQSLLYGLAGIGQNEAVSEQQKQSEDEREPAEAEVKAVLNICTGCDEEPFDKALVIGWRTVPKKLYSGAFYTPAIPQCKVF
ncbi:unnamed protein product [Phaedon cochleariae]|uniref:Pentraxin (PTX) domain-containing protein n=1 Tax=Phaedon cochleariae TaxID=80249 RepID=A0A9N9SHW0_PHACE|nr:unnamed protein product [Phaedon cochleariae]